MVRDKGLMYEKRVSAKSVRLKVEKISITLKNGTHEQK
jgi:hypothetical protein